MPFIIVFEALRREVRSKCPGNLAMIEESLDDLKGKVVALIGVLKSVVKERQFACSKKLSDSDSILCQSCKCYVHMRSIKGRRKHDDKFECQTCISQEIDTAEECPGIELNFQFLEVLEKVFYLLVTIGALAQLT